MVIGPQANTHYPDNVEYGMQTEVTTKSSEKYTVFPKNFTFYRALR